MKSTGIFMAVPLITTLASVPSQSHSQTVIPGHVVQCYQDIAGEILDGNLNRATVERYVNPENVLQSMRNPDTPELRNRVIESALSFAQFLYDRIQREGHNFESSDIVFTRYATSSTQIILNGRLG